MGTGKAYVALRPCGCMAAAMVVPADTDPASYKGSVAKEVAACIREGYQIEVVSCDWVRSHSFRCDVCKPPKSKQQKLPKGTSK